MKIWLFCLWASRQDILTHTSTHFKPSDTQTPGPSAYDSLKQSHSIDSFFAFIRTALEESNFVHKALILSYHQSNKGTRYAEGARPFQSS